MKRSIALLLCGCSLALPAQASEQTPLDGAFHVHGGESIQAALDAAADSRIKLVRVHPGTYRPDSHRQALIWFTARHDGIVLEAVGDVTLTAVNSELSDPRHTGHPAVVNHVVYFGDGIGPETVIRGFHITGANNFVIDQPPVEPSIAFRKDFFFVADGGGIKIFGRSYPTIDSVEIVGNYASPCGGGVSVQHNGHTSEMVRFRNCVFRDNRTQMTGAAIDLLPGSAAEIVNSLFVGNIANTGFDFVTLWNGAPFGRTIRSSGVLTVFPGSRAIVRRCTFAGNRNGVDDEGFGSVYEDSIFWDNRLDGGLYPTEGFDLEVNAGARISGCFFGGPSTGGPPGAASPSDNVFDAPDPRFDARWVPRNAAYDGVGYRPPD